MYAHKQTIIHMSIQVYMYIQHKHTHTGHEYIYTSSNEIKDQNN